MLFAIGGAVAGAITYLRVLDQAPEAGQPLPAGKAAFVELDPVNVTIARDDEAKETRTYIFVLETRSGGQYLTGQQRTKLRDTYTRYLATLAERAGPENLENVPYVRTQLQGAANDILGANTVRNVLIRSMLSNVTG
jgi:uncharacterized membrane protein